jgi:hypothetical protein
MPASIRRRPEGVSGEGLGRIEEPEPAPAPRLHDLSAKPGYVGPFGNVYLVMAARLVFAFGLALLLAGCQIPGSRPACNAAIDWVNFIEVGSTQYVAGLGSPDVLQASDLGPVHAHVKFKVSGNVCDPSYRLKDGDAAFLEPGTPIYEVNGHPPDEELAARFNGSIVIYRAM